MSVCVVFSGWFHLIKSISKCFITIIIIYKMCSMPFAIPQLFFFSNLFIYCFFFVLFFREKKIGKKHINEYWNESVGNMCIRFIGDVLIICREECVWEREIGNTSSNSIRSSNRYTDDDDSDLTMGLWDYYEFNKSLLNYIYTLNLLIKLEGQFIHQIEQLQRL